MTTPGDYERAQAEAARRRGEERLERDLYAVAGLLSRHGWAGVVGLLGSAERLTSAFRDNHKDAAARQVIIDARRAAKRAREPQLTITLRRDRHEEDGGKMAPTLRVRVARRARSREAD